MYYAGDMEDIDLPPNVARCVAVAYIVVISTVIYFSLS